MNIKELISKNIKEIPYEGLNIDKDGIENLIENLLKGMVSFSHKFVKTSKGYSKEGTYYSKEEIVQMFLKQ